jgi:hypothetical protein
MPPDQRSGKASPLAKPSLSKKGISAVRFGYRPKSDCKADVNRSTSHAAAAAKAAAQPQASLGPQPLRRAPATPAPQPAQPAAITKTYSSARCETMPAVERKPVTRRTASDHGNTWTRQWPCAAR